MWVVSLSSVRISELVGGGGGVSRAINGEEGIRTGVSFFVFCVSGGGA